MKQLSLNGTWSLRGSSGCRGGMGGWPNHVPEYPAREITVPGTVQEAFEDLTGDVMEGHNSLLARWIEEQKWLFTRTFTVDAADAAGAARLVFEGLDLTAKIFLNGEPVGEHNDFFTPCRIDVTGKIHAGENRVDVILESGLFDVYDKSVVGVHPVQLGDEMKLHKRVWMRKPQSSCEWDWAPRILTVGIYKSCYIEFSSGVFVNEASVFADLSDDYARGTVRIRQFLAASGEAKKCFVTAEIVETGASATVDAIAGANAPAQLQLSVKNPLLWNPRGYGEQNRYTVRITVKAGDRVVDVKERKIGFRRVRVLQEKHPKEGYYFILDVNGNHIFTKGGNFVPADSLYSRLTDDVYDTLIDRALEANFNAFRVWGGGLYETDRFYELCDEKGIVVWQDFIFACAGYPGTDAAFYQRVREEVRYQIRRLSSAACIVIWSGNNEIDDQIELFGEGAGVRYPDANIYYYLLPRTLKAEGDTRYYQPSSPYSPDYSTDNSETVGDQHPWYCNMVEYESFRKSVARFADEGGVLGPTSYPNTLKCLSGGQEYVFSFDWQHHDNSCVHSSANLIRTMVRYRFGLEIPSLSIPEYIYTAGMNQGEGLTEYILNYRRRMYDSASAIFWMYNDCWPCTSSWTVVDYLRNRTPAFWAVKRANQSVVAEITETEGETAYSIYGINERLYTVKASLEIGLVSFDGQFKNQQILSVTLAPNASSVIAQLPKEEGYIPYLILTPENEESFFRRLLSKPFKDLPLQKSVIRVEREGDFTVYASDTLTFGVCIDINGEQAIGDNFFDLLPGRPKRVYTPNIRAEVLFTVNGILCK